MRLTPPSIAGISVSNIDVSRSSDSVVVLRRYSVHVLLEAFVVGATRRHTRVEFEVALTSEEEAAIHAVLNQIEARLRTEE